MVEYTTDNRAVSGSTPLIPNKEKIMKNDKVRVTLRVCGEYEDYSTHIIDAKDLKKFKNFVEEFNASVNSVSLEIIESEYF